MVVVSTKIKFCGITTLDDAERAVGAGAWAIGLIFWPRSPRRCELDAAGEIAGAVKRRVEVAGVFVNATLDQVAETADAVGLTMLQLHGDEGPAFCAEAARRTGCKVIKAVRVRSGADVQALAAFHTDYHLLDSYVAGVPGGTGETFAWELARGLDPPRARVPVILSGGLTPDNVAEAIAAVRPFAVDVASGVELTPRSQGPDEADGVRGRRARSPAVAAGAPMSAVEHRFGPYGGQYVPETLMPALAELEDAWVAARDDPASAPSSTRCCATTSGGRRRCTTPAAERGRRAPDLPQARGPQPHRRAQDQQRARAGAAGPADGQAADHRRDRRRQARRRHRHRVRAARPRVHRLHGHRGHAPPEAQRRADGAARRAVSSRSRPGRGR